MAFKGNLLQLSDLLTDRKDRSGKAVYFVRMDCFTPQIDEILQKCVLKAQKCGLLLDNKLAAPDVEQITHYQDIIGEDFEINLQFIDQALAKWIAPVAQDTRNALSDALIRMLTQLKKAGKNPNVLKNAFTKYMCWISYQFLQLLLNISEETAPVVIYNSSISIYELQMLMILCYAGCDIILIQNKDDNYEKLDPDHQYAQKLEINDGKPFPENYTIQSIVEKLAKSQIPASVAVPKPKPSNPVPPITALKTNHVTLPSGTPKPVAPTASQHPKTSNHNFTPPKPPVPSNPQDIDLGPNSKYKVLTNSWCTRDPSLSNVLIPFAVRTSNPNQLCNLFILESGVNNISTYENDLYQLYQQMLDAKRRLVIARKDFNTPTPDEIAQLHRGNYNLAEGMIKDLSTNIVIPGNFELQKLIARAFCTAMLEYTSDPEIGLSEATRTAICMICWLRRCQKKLFDAWNPPTVGCFIYVGACTSPKEALFLRMLAYMPVDVLILNPNLDELSTIQDNRIHMIKNMSSLQMDKFPTDKRNIRITTEGYQAERDLNLLIEDSGTYRSQQFKQAESFRLHSSYYEIPQLWDTPVSDRPNFEVNKGVVNIPTLFAKICGVKQEKEEDYWLHIKSFITPNTHLINQLPNMSTSKLSPIASSMPELYKDHKLQRERIKTHRHYPYTLLRPSMQEHMLDMIEEIIKQKMIRGTGERNTDFMIVASALSLSMPIQRLIQQFDFTQKNPKIIVLNTGETTGSIQDAIQLAFLNLIGFDVLFFIPSGYQCVERWYQSDIIAEHDLGNYQYHLTVPDFETLTENNKQSWFNKFKRNN